MKQIETESPYIFYGSIGLLLILGSLFIYSSSCIFALTRYHIPYFFVQKQLCGILLGLSAIAIIQYIPIDYIIRLRMPLLAVCTALTAMTLIPQFAQHIHGSSRWIRLAKITFQPSELLKLSLLIYLAALLEQFAYYKKRSHAYAYIQLSIILSLISCILLKQPDFGMTVTLVVTTLMLLFVTHMPLRYFAAAIGTLIPIGITLIYYYPYRIKRILVFLNPWQDPQGSGFQIIQSLIAIGSGGLFGKGIGNSQQKFFYLPMQHTDFIFSIIAEEIGFVGACALIILFIILLYMGIRLAMSMKRPFSCYFILGSTLLISLQTIINISVASGLAPTKGIGLPFISYGNTGLVVLLIMLGIIAACVKHDTMQPSTF